MNHFDYRNGVLHAEAVNLIDLADSVGTPFYCYSTATLERHYRVFTEAFAGEKALVCYAMKANSNQSVLRTLAKLGAGADVVSGGELKRALAAGIPPQKILFSGVGKTEAELRAALGLPTFSASTSSPSPSSNCCRGSRSRAGKTARISVRVNPDVDAGTHAKISTGKSENKFGIPIAPRPRGLCPRGETAGHRGDRHRYAYRQPDHRSEQDGDRVPDSVGIRSDAARRRPHHLACRFRRRASAFPITWTAKRRPRRMPMPRWSSA